MRPVFSVLHEQVDVLIKQTNPVCLFAIVHPSAHPLYAGGPVGVAKRACVHRRYLHNNTERQGRLFITGNVIESTPLASAYISRQ